MSDSLRRVAVIGSGYWGKNLVRNFHALGALAMVCDANAAVRRALAGQYPGLETRPALAAVLAHDAVDGVVVATPAETHYALAREALLAGKHVFVEKPLALDARQGRELVALAEEKKRILMVGHLLHYHPAFLRLKELAASGALGRIDYISSHRLNLGKIRREENILWSFAPHDISMILSLAGEMPDRVFAVGGNYLHKRIADVTTTHLAFPSGLKAHVFVSWLHPFKEQKLVLVGERKMAVFDDTLPWSGKLALYPREIRWENSVPVPAGAVPEAVPLAACEPLRLECEHFLDCMATGRAPATDGREGLRVLEVLNASQACLDNGRPAPVPSPAAAVDAADADAGEKDYFVHATATVEAGARIGTGSRIWHYSRVLSGTSLGARVNVGQNVVIGPDVAVGAGCKIQNNVSVYKGVTLEDDVFCGPSVVFTNIVNPRARIPRMAELRETLVRTGATLGANCTIVCGHTVGRHAFVGAGAVVTRDVPDHALVVGNPARRSGWMCACGGKLSAGLVCAACGAAYAEGPSGLTPKA